MISVLRCTQYFIISGSKPPMLRRKADCSPISETLCDHAPRPGVSISLSPTSARTSKKRFYGTVWKRRSASASFLADVVLQDAADPKPARRQKVTIRVELELNRGRTGKARTAGQAEQERQSRSIGSRTSPAQASDMQEDTRTARNKHLSAITFPKRNTNGHEAHGGQRHFGAQLRRHAGPERPLPGQREAEIVAPRAYE